MSDELEIEALSDEDLEEVAGGAENTCTSTSCSEKDCSGGGDDTTSTTVSVAAT